MVGVEPTRPCVSGLQIRAPCCRSFSSSRCCARGRVGVGAASRDACATWRGGCEFYCVSLRFLAAKRYSIALAPPLPPRSLTAGSALLHQTDSLLGSVAQADMHFMSMPPPVWPVDASYAYWGGAVLQGRPTEEMIYASTSGYASPWRPEPRLQC